jgi:N-acetyl-D-muramate 6-phosphate phosphatase
MPVRSVIFDVGETLMSDGREWNAWADWIDVPRHVFLIVLGAVTAAGRDNAETFQYFKPGFDLAAERQAREEAGKGETYDETDLYPDVRPTLSALRDIGLWVGIAGNQTTRAGSILRSLDLPADMIATSGEWGVAKPARGFFEHIIDAAPGEPHEIVYVGDHRDNDLVPAKSAGLRAVHLRRGPWGHLWADDPTVRNQADWRITNLAELPALMLAERTAPSSWSTWQG